MFHDPTRVALWLVSSTFFASAAAVANVGVIAPIVDLGYAQYQGRFDRQTNVTNFLSVRYAAPPVGNLRFQAPQAPLFEPEVQAATQNPNMCHQAGPRTIATAPASTNRHTARQRTAPVASEDCLFLNVYVPGTMPTESNSAGGLPVLVWIHGGGRVYRYGDAARYNGAKLVVDSSNTIVVVVIQYRLGAFGFLSGNEVKSQGALNAGLLDQRFALEWVQRHIGQFGGDKDHVTIWGESAGAGSVMQHIVADGGNTQPPLFNAMITSSTFLPPQYYYNDRVPQLLYDKIVAMTGCTSSADTFACLQSVDEETLRTVNDDLVTSPPIGKYVFVPVVDGTFIVERPTATLAKGRVNGQVVLSITNENEGDIFVRANETSTITSYVSRLFPEMTISQLEETAQVYREYGTAFEQAIMVLGDSIFVCPTYYLLRAFAGRSWKGLFAVPPAYHLDDISYYFYSPPPYNDTQFINAFSQSFMSVVKHYDVNAKFDPTNITPGWNKHDVGRTEMLFNSTEKGVPVVMPVTADQTLLQRCAFWETMAEATAQSSERVGLRVLDSKDYGHSFPSTH